MIRLLQQKIFNQILSVDSTSHTNTYRLQLQTQIARTFSLRGEFEQAHTILDNLESDMAGEEDIVAVRYLLKRGRCFNSAGQPEKAMPLFLKAARIAEKIGAEFYWIDALHMLGITAPEPDQLDWHLKGLETAQNCSDKRARRWQGSLLNNIGWTYFDQKDYQNALKAFKATADFYKDSSDKLHQFQIAQWSIAKTLRMLDRPEEGLVILRELEDSGKMDGFTEEEIGECLLAIGKTDDAKPYFQTAYHKLSQIFWVSEDTERIAKLKRYASETSPKGHDSY